MKALLQLTLIIILLSGCAGLHDTQRSSQPSMATLLAKAEADENREAERIALELQRSLEPRMSKDQVRLIAGRTFAQRGIDARSDGEPQRRHFEEDGNSVIEIWEYTWFNRAVVVSFRDSAVIGMRVEERESRIRY